MVDKYRLIKITVPGVYYAKNNEDLSDSLQNNKNIVQASPNFKTQWMNWAYADNLENSVGVIMNQFSLVNTDLCYESTGYAVYVNGITVTLSDGQFEYL
jgi:hypothetical protein